MIRILDSTLREGEQTPGVYFSPAAKLRIAALLDQIGVDVIEAGNPSVDPEIATSVKEIVRAGLRAKIGAHARCRIGDVEKALSCGPGFLGVFLCVSERRLQQDYRLTFAQALDRIRTVVSCARATDRSLEIRFTLEDAVRTPYAQLIETAVAAVEAGADIISLADTTGFANPFSKERSLGQMVRRLKTELAAQNLEPQIEVHCHNDRGLALANALDACRAGAEVIDATVLGLGERAGIVDLAELLVSLREIADQVTRLDFASLGKLYQLVSREAQIPVPVNHPILGQHAFTHTAGIHVNALVQDENSYQSIKPEHFGRKPQFALGVQSGSTSIELALAAIGRANLSANESLVSNVLREVKSRGRKGGSVRVEQEFPELVKRVTEG